MALLSLINWSPASGKTGQSLCVFFLSLSRVAPMTIRADGTSCENETRLPGEKLMSKTPSPVDDMAYACDIVRAHHRAPTPIDQEIFCFGIR